MNVMNKSQMVDKEYITSVQSQKRKENYFYTMLSVISILGFFLIWQILVSSGAVSNRYLSTPLDIFNLFIVKLTDPNPDGAILTVNILSSLQVSMTGFLIAIVIGIPIGWIMGWFRGFDVFVRPIFELIRPIPPVAWIPLVIVWLSIGLKAKAFIVFFAAFVSCVINSYAGIKQTKTVLINVAKCCGASYLTTFFRVAIPSAMPMTFAGIRIALGESWSTLVAAEMLAASSGLGYMILMGRQFARPDLIILGIIVIGLIGLIIDFCLKFVENKVMRWKKV